MTKNSNETLYSK